MDTIILCQSEYNVRQVYAPAKMDRLRAETGADGHIYTREELLEKPLPGVTTVFSTWGMPALTEEEIATYLPNLTALYYAAGTVQVFARPFLARGIRVFSAWQANAVPVARFTAAQILLALKGYFRVQPLCRNDRTAAKALLAHYPGSYDARVGLVGCGAIGRRVATLLKDMDLTVLVYDPYLPVEEARALGVERVSLEKLFSTCQVVSNHLPDLASTKGLIRRELLLSMPPYSTFINTGRGAQLSEEDLCDMLTEDDTRTALIDVLVGEQDSVDKPLNRLPNCFITPHMAGSSGLEVRRMADYMLEALACVRAGRPCPYEVFPRMLDTMA